MPVDQVDVVEPDVSESCLDGGVHPNRQRQHTSLGMLTSIEVEIRTDTSPQHELSNPLPLRSGIVTSCVMPAEVQFQGIRRRTTSRRRWWWSFRRRWW